MFVFMIMIGLAAAYIGGMHDGGTMVATVISARIISAKKAVILAGAANFLGAVLLGTAVAYMISGDIVDIGHVLRGSSHQCYVFVAAAFAGGIVWNVLTWILKLPSSGSHSLIGAMIGSGIAAYGFAYIQWSSILFKVVIAMMISPILGFVIGFLFMKLENRILKNGTMIWGARVRTLDKISSFLLAFCYGSNDSQKIMGLIAIGIAAHGSGKIYVPFWLIVPCSAALAVGTVTGGYKMIKTVGMEITKIDSKNSFASQLSAVTVVIGANFMGVPISATQVVTGSVMGVGTENTPKSVNWKITQKIIAAWLITLPVSAAMGGGLFLLMSLI